MSARGGAPKCGSLGVRDDVRMLGWQRVSVRDDVRMQGWQRVSVRDDVRMLGWQRVSVREQVRSARCGRHGRSRVTLVGVMDKLRRES